MHPHNCLFWCPLAEDKGYWNHPPTDEKTCCFCVIFSETTSLLNKNEHRKHFVIDTVWLHVCVRVYTNLQCFTFEPTRVDFWIFTSFSLGHYQKFVFWSLKNVTITGFKLSQQKKSLWTTKVKTTWKYCSLALWWAWYYLKKSVFCKWGSLSYSVITVY